MRTEQAVSETDYARAYAEIRRLMEAEPDRGTPEGDRLDALAGLIEAYEANGSAGDRSDIEYR
jgi:antitoxin component HigA of HigAB toxin-antitoxin module